jgi:hypothetical protein
MIPTAHILCVGVSALQQIHFLSERSGFATSKIETCSRQLRFALNIGTCWPEVESH